MIVYRDRTGALKSFRNGKSPLNDYPENRPDGWEAVLKTVLLVMNR